MVADSASSYDVIVVGGGLAGLRAARDIHHAGLTVGLLEARDRLGGRTWSRPFFGHDQLVELGGTWVCPRYQPWIAREMERYGLSLAERRRAEPRFLWCLEGRTSYDFPLRGDELYELERALYHIIAANHRIDITRPRDRQDLGDLDVSVETFLDGLRLSERTHAFLAAFGALGSGAHASEWSALGAFSVMAAANRGAYAWYAAAVDKLAGGTGVLVSALLQDAQPALRLSTCATRVDQVGGEVTVSTACGATFKASVAIVAAPVNVWRDIEFEPELSPAKAALAREGHPNRMGKVWVLVEGAPRDVVGFGAHSDLLYLAPQYELAEGSLMVGFRAPPSSLDISDRQAVQRAVRRYFPDAVVHACDSHDWSVDPWSRGGWLVYRPGQASRFMSSVQQPEDRVMFAGADIANGWIGWIDGALESGAHAARSALDRLRQSRRRARAGVRT